MSKQKYLVDENGEVFSPIVSTNSIYDEEGNSLSNYIKSVVGEMYPVGSILMNTTGANPANYLKFGTWSAWGSGRVPVGVDSSDADFNASEKTGGSKLLASHTHSFSTTSGAQNTNHTHSISITSGNNSVGHTHTWSGTTSSTGAHTHTANSAGAHVHGIRYRAYSGSNFSADKTGYVLLRRNESADGYDGTDSDAAMSAGAHTHSTTSNGVHTHTVSGTTGGQSANHTHSISGTSGSNSANHAHSVSGTTGTAGSGNSGNVQPYITCYMWKRTA